MAVFFGELLGELKPASSGRSAAPSVNVVLSSISHGSSASPSWPGITLRYVGRGTEHYRIDGRHYRLGEGQMMIAPQTLGCEIEVRRRDREGTLGLCIFLPPGDAGLESLPYGPVVLPADCDLGMSLKDSLTRLWTPQRSRSEAERAAAGAKAHLFGTLEAIERQVDAIPGAKRVTRFEAMRRVNFARAYLHAITDRAVPLDELAREVAVSPFQLLRTFRECFGETPASYHRRLRLTLAREFAEQGGHCYAFAAARFGFAGGDAFSHAYRRTFGHAPVRQLGAGRDDRGR